MRKTIATVIILGLVSIGYTAWPLYDLLVLVRAIETRDVHTVTRHVYFDAVPSAWLRRKLFQPCDGGRLLLAMYFATVVCPTSMPSLSSSPWIRGAPQSGFATLMSRMSWRMSAGVLGRPTRGRDFQRQ